MNFDDMENAVNEAQQTLNCADKFVGKMLRMCIGRLRKSDASSWTLTALKKELRDWDMHRGCWIERK